MATTNYDTINGQIVSEHNNGVQTDYITDALGSVVATANQFAQVVNTYTYKPSGAVLAKTGVARDPRFMWVGTWGYRTTGRNYSEEYVGARHYSNLTGQWTTVDPMWPWEEAHVYARGNPTTYFDPDGLNPLIQLAVDMARAAICPPKKCCCCPTGVKIRNIRTNDDARDGHPAFGHYFEVVIGYSYHEISKDEAESDCQLEWWETNSIRQNNIPPNTPTEMYDYFMGQSATFTPWLFREKPCPGAPKNQPVLVDDPRLVIDQGPITRDLSFRIVVRAGAGCKCPTHSMQVTAKQHLKVGRGKGVERRFTTP